MSKPRRILSIDIFRGITIAMMIIVNNPGSWSHVYAPLRHAKWHGCTPTDLIFPFFLFIVGTSMRFAFVRWHSFASNKFYKHVFIRTISIFIAGSLIHAFPFIQQDWDWDSYRIMGVLQRIALAYGIAAIIAIHLDLKKIFVSCIGILTFYWAILVLGGGSEPFSLENNLIRKIDIFILGQSHLYGGTGIQFDPEGLLSTIPSVVTVLIGYLVGAMLHTTKDFWDNIKRMSILGISLIISGLIWSLFLPINKQLWTSSYVLFTGGIATLFLTFLCWMIDIKKWKRPLWFFQIFGTNSIFLFVLSGFWTKTILRIKFTLGGETISGYNYLYKTLFIPLAGELSGSLLFAVAHLFGFWLVLLWLYRRKIFINL
jgi:predicted acyltransferase